MRVKTSKPTVAQENASDHVAVGLSFESAWLRRWREMPGPVQSNPRLLSTLSWKLLSDLKLDNNRNSEVTNFVAIALNTESK